MADPAIVAEGLGKRFGDVTAINGVDLELPAVRRRIGLSGQYAAVDPFLAGQENLVMIGRLPAAVASYRHATST